MEIMAVRANKRRLAETSEVLEMDNKQESNERVISKTPENLESPDNKLKRLIFEHELDANQVSGLKRLFEFIDDEKINIRMISFYAQDLPENLLKSTEIKTAVENAILRNVSTGEGIGTLDVYADLFGITPDFFRDPRLDSHRQKFWREKISNGKLSLNNNQCEEEFSCLESPEEKQLDEAYDGTYPEAKKLLPKESLKPLGLSGVANIADLGNWIRKGENRPAKMATYQQEFKLKDEEIADALIRRVSSNLFYADIAPEVLEKYPAVKEFMEKPETKERVKEEAIKRLLDGSDIKKLLQRFNLQSNDFNQDKIIAIAEKEFQAPKNNEISVDNLDDYLSDDKLQELGQKIILLNPEKQKKFFSRYYQKATLYGQELLKKEKDGNIEKDNYAQKTLGVFRRLNIPAEITADFAKMAVISNIKHSNYDKRWEDEYAATNEIFKLSPDKFEEAKNIGLLRKKVERNDLLGFIQAQEHVLASVGLEKLTLFPEVLVEIKRAYLESAKKGQTDNLKYLDAFLEEHHERLDFNQAETNELKINAEAGALKNLMSGREKVLSFLKKYHPDRHIVFTIAKPEFKANAEQIIVDELFSSNRYSAKPFIENIRDLVWYFDLDQQKITAAIDKSQPFISSQGAASPGKILAGIFPQFDIQGHNQRYIATQDPYEIMLKAVNSSDPLFIAAIAEHENTKEIFSKELAGREKKVISGKFLETENKSGDIKFIKATLPFGSITEGLKEKQIDEVFSLNREDDCLLILGGLGRELREKRADSPWLKLMARDNERRLFTLLENLKQSSDMGAFSSRDVQILKNDFELEAANFQKNGKIDLDGLVAAIEEHFEKILDTNLGVDIKNIDQSDILGSLKGELYNTQNQVMSGQREIVEEEAFMRLASKYLIADFKSSAVSLDKVYNRDKNPEASFGANDWAEALTAYVNVLESDHSSQDLKDRLSDIFSGSYRDLTLEKMSQAWLGFLKDNNKQEIPFKLRTISDTVADFGGAGNLSKVETLCGLIEKIKDVIGSPKTAPRTREEIKFMLADEEARFQKEKWSQDDVSSFRSLAGDIIEAAPSLFSAFEPIFKSLSGKDIKVFIKELLPLYQAQLITMQTGETDEKTEYNPRDLVALRQNIHNLAANLILDKNPQTAILEEKRNLLENVKSGFASRFGLQKIPTEITKEHFRDIHNVVRYTGNMSGRNQQRETIASFYLGLELNGDWKKFRQGEHLKAEDYLSPEKAALIKDNLESKYANELKAETIGIPEKRLPDFQEKLQAETMNSIIGNVETIDIKLGNIKRNVDELLDPDAYDDERDKKMLPILEHNHKAVGSVLAKTFQVLSGRDLTFSPEEKELQNELGAALGFSVWSLDKVKMAQERIQPLSLINNLSKKMMDIGLENKISELNRSLEPGENIIKVFNRLDENFKTGSGAMAISRDLEYLENLIVKNEGRLSVEEAKEVKVYIGEIREKMSEMEKIMEATKEYFNKIKGSAHTGGEIKNRKLRERINEIEKIINSKGEAAMIISEMTNDPNMVIENMRQCLGCLRKEINNDTNLAFGDYNKFFMTSRQEKNKGSIADEIVFFLPVKQENGEEKMSFVMDRIYGSKSSDILISHILTVYKKFQGLKSGFEGAKISLSISAEAMSSAGIDADTLKKRLAEKEPKLKNAEFKDNLTANVPVSAFSDNYIEFGEGSARQTGNRKFKALVIE
jgi:hypothetical protein